MSSYGIGNVVRVTGNFTDPFNSDADTDPGLVKAAIKNPSGNLTTYVYGTDAELVRSTTGVYYVDVYFDEVGTWHIRIYSETTGIAAAEQTFHCSKHNAV